MATNVANRPTLSASVGPKASKSALSQAVVNRTLASCDSTLAAAAIAVTPADRFIYAHLAAVRAAGAYLKLIGVPTANRGAFRSVWERLAAASPEMSLWAAYFAAGTKTRIAIEAGESVSESDCDEMLGLAEDFRDEVVAAARALGPPSRQQLTSLTYGYASAA